MNRVEDPRGPCVFAVGLDRGVDGEDCGPGESRRGAEERRGPFQRRRLCLPLACVGVHVSIAFQVLCETVCAIQPGIVKRISDSPLPYPFDRRRSAARGGSGS